MSELELKIAKEQYNKLLRAYSIDLRVLNEYQRIGTPKEFAALKEKNEPKDICYQQGVNKLQYAKCPSCQSLHVFGDYCSDCGQRVWWNVEAGVM